MKKFNLKYGNRLESFLLPEKNYLGTLEPNELTFDLKDEEEVKRALENPIKSKKISEIVKPGESVAIITSDITRPMPSKLVLPLIIDELEKAGINKKDIKIILALGSHRKHTDKEKKYLVGKNIFESNIEIIDSDMNKCKRLGKCKNGTFVDIFKPVLNSDRIICLGNIEYHYFAGYSGGSKAIMPGVSSWEAIQSNHKNMIKSEAKAGSYENNPVRSDINQVGEFLKIDFILNVILNKKKEIIKAVSGHYIHAHKLGCKVLDKLYGVKILKKADIVVTTPGGYPKDLNLYQSQKALDNSKHAVKKDGIIILIASSKEGFGEERFEKWMLNKTPDEMIKSIKKDFKLGGHKAASIGEILKRNKIFFVSDLGEKLVRKIGFFPFSSSQEALNFAIKEKGENAEVLVIPSGGSVLPIKI